MADKISVKETMKFKEFDIMLGDTVIGSAEIEYPNMTLNNFHIYPTYRNKGYGSEAVKLFVEKYGVTNLFVKPDNEIAKHVYEKNGFVSDSEPLYIAMRVKRN